MRKIIYVIIFAFLSVAVACNKKELQPGRVEKVSDGGVCVLTTAIDGCVATKVAAQSEANERTIRNVQVFVFRAGEGADQGVLEIAKSAGFLTPLEVSSGAYRGITVKCSTGLREVWVVVNDSEDRTSGPNAVQSKTEFLALTHDLEASTPSKLLMVGRSNPESTNPAVSLSEGSMTISVPVHRLAAGIVLESVTNDFSSPAYQKPGCFRLDAAYLLNVPGRVNFGESMSSTSLASEFWYGQLAAETNGARMDLMYDGLSGVMKDYGSKYDTPHTFYTYPNSCALSTAATFAPRATLLVVEASLLYEDGWRKFYYPVVIGREDGTGWVGVSSNKLYHVNLTIHRPGSLDPNVPVTFADATPSVTVSDWEVGFTLDPEI